MTIFRGSELVPVHFAEEKIYNLNSAMQFQLTVFVLLGSNYSLVELLTWLIYDISLLSLVVQASLEVRPRGL